MLNDLKAAATQLLGVVAHRAEDDLRACAVNWATPEHRERLNHHDPLSPLERGVAGHQLVAENECRVAHDRSVLWR